MLFIPIFKYISIIPSHSTSHSISVGSVCSADPYMIPRPAHLLSLPLLPGMEVSPLGGGVQTG